MTFRKSIFIMLMLAVAFVTAEPPRFRSRNSRLQQQRLRRPFFARQESAPSPPQPDSAALYPSADELKPENPFEIEEEIADPDLVYGPPDSIYEPPLPETDALPAVEAPPEFAPNPDAEEFATLLQQRPSSRLQQRPKQQRAQLHLVQKTQRLQQRRRPQQQQRTTIRQIVDVPRQRATIQQVVSAQRLVARPSAAGAIVVAAPASTPRKVVVNSERLVAESTPIFSASVDIPAGESYYVVNAPFAYSAQYQAF